MNRKPAGKSNTLLPVPQLPQTKGAQAQPKSSFGSKLTGVKTDRGSFSFKANKGGFKV